MYSSDLLNRLVPRSSREDTQALSHQGQQRRRFKHLAARRCEFDGERQPVKSPADVRHGLRVVLAQCESGPDRLRSSHEEHHRRGRPDLWQQADSCPRQCQWQDREFLLTGDMERHAAGDQHPEFWQALQEVGELVGSRDNVLEIVEDQQDSLTTESQFQALGAGAISSLTDTDHAGNRRYDEIRIGNSRKGDQADAVREVPAQRMRDLEGKARLPDPTSPCQCHEKQIIPGKQTPDIVEFALSPNQRGAQERELSGSR